VRPEERVREQNLVLDLSFPADFAAAADSEELARTVDYSALTREAGEFLRREQFRLLETLARGLGRHLCETFGLERLSLTVRKPEAIADAAGPAVSLTIRREGPPGS
jgi:dihydroneopterin aldolase